MFETTEHDQGVTRRVESAARGRGSLLFVVNEAYFFVSRRLPIARAARETGFEVHLATPTDNVWAPADYDPQLLSAEGIVFHPIPLERRGRNPWADLRTFLAIWRLFRRLRPDVVHLVTIKPVLYGGIAARLAGVRAMVSAVSGLGQVFTAQGARAGFLCWLICRLYAVATASPNGRVIVQNSEDADRLKSLGAVAPDRLRWCVARAPISMRFHPALRPMVRPSSCLLPVCCGKRGSASSLRLRAGSNNRACRRAS